MNLHILRLPHSVQIVSIALVLAVSSGVARSQSPNDTPYRMLREAYAASDPNAAADAYDTDAAYAELYPGAPPLVLSGHAKIRDHFAQLMDQFAGSDRKRRIDLINRNRQVAIIHQVNLPIHQ